MGFFILKEKELLKKPAVNNKGRLMCEFQMTVTLANESLIEK